MCRRSVVGFLVVAILPAGLPAEAVAGPGTMITLDAVRRAPAVVVPEGAEAPPDVKVVREWSGPLCRSRLVNEDVRLPGRTVACLLNWDDRPRTLGIFGFMGGWNQPGTFHPLVAATFGALLTTWVTFTPCFLWVFLGGPHIEQLRGNKTISMALSAITAAVVGVVLNLAIWFALHVFQPEGAGVDWFHCCRHPFVHTLAFEVRVRQCGIPQPWV